MKHVVLFALFLIALVGCQAPATAQEAHDGELSPWMTAELKDVRTGETFTVAGFDRPVLVESFAVWCPLCTKQQNNIKKLHEELGDSFVSIALDTDPNEDEAIVKEHAKSNGFDWRYSVAPKELTQALVDQFGLGVVNAPRAPVVLVCEDQSTRLLPGGVKSPDELKGEMAKGC